VHVSVVLNIDTKRTQSSACQNTWLQMTPLWYSCLFGEWNAVNVPGIAQWSVTQYWDIAWGSFHFYYWLPRGSPLVWCCRPAVFPSRSPELCVFSVPLQPEVSLEWRDNLGKRSITPWITQSPVYGTRIRVAAEAMSASLSRRNLIDQDTG